MKEDLKPSLKSIQECSIPKKCPFCGKELKVQEPDSTKRLNMDSLRCLCCGAIACWCGCGNVYFPEFKIDTDTNKLKPEIKCPKCGLTPLNH